MIELVGRIIFPNTKEVGFFRLSGSEPVKREVLVNSFLLNYLSTQGCLLRNQRKKICNCLYRNKVLRQGF